MDIDIPASAVQVVIEGRVENGQPPVVFVSRTRGFFEPTTLEDFVDSYVNDADVFVNGIPLTRLCANELGEEFAPLFEEITGFVLGEGPLPAICAYIGTDPLLLGVENTSYRLEVEALGRNLSATAHLPVAFTPDSVWFRLWANSPAFGFVFANISDPDTIGNAYRVFTRRIGPNMNNNPEDGSYFAPLGAAFADDFFNGQTIEVGFTRGQPPNSSRPVDQGESSRFFEVGDRFVFKFCSTDMQVYEFFRTLEAQVGSNGSPFAAPNNVSSNINGGLGIWAAYACTTDTLLAVP